MREHALLETFAYACVIAFHFIMHGAARLHEVHREQSDSIKRRRHPQSLFPQALAKPFDELFEIATRSESRHSCAQRTVYEAQPRSGLFSFSLIAKKAR